MGPGRFGGFGPSAAAVLGAVAVAIMVVAMVNVGGGIDRPLVAPPAHVAAASPTHGQG
jgi:hypothetical protein